MSRKPLFEKKVSLSEEELAQIVTWYFEESPDVLNEGRTLAGVEIRYDTKRKEVSADVSLILKQAKTELDESEVEDRIDLHNLLPEGTI